MDDFEVTKEEPVTIARVKALLGSKKKEATYEQKQALEHAKAFSKLSEKDSEEMLKELKALDIKKLKEMHLIRIVDFMPKDEEDLKNLFATEKLGLKADENEKILELVKKYAKEKK